MSVSWTLTDVELIVLWDRLFRDRLPHPLFALQRGGNLGGWERLATEAWEGLRTRDDGALNDALNRVAQADVRVRAHLTDPRDQQDPVTRVRVLGARQGASAVLIRQLPGETVWHSGGFVITMGDAERLAGAVVGALPQCPAAEGPDIPLVTRDRGHTEYHHGRSLASAGYLDADRRSAAWLEHPAALAGSIETAQGSSIYGSRGITTYRIGLRDLVGVGRYAVPETYDPIAAPVDRHRLAALIAADIAKVVQTLEDERCA